MKRSFPILTALFLVFSSPVLSHPGEERVPDPQLDTIRPDYSDKEFAPIASHMHHSLEWLGPWVTEEADPKDPDDADDGLTVWNPGNFGPDNVVKLSVTLRTRWQVQPNAFGQSGTITKLGIWIDWNYDKTFADNEVAFLAAYSLPFGRENNQVPDAVLAIPIRVPDSFRPLSVSSENLSGVQPPSIRLRVAYVHADEKLKPGGRYTFGEVEDHTLPPNDLVEVPDGSGRDGSFAMLSQGTQYMVRILSGDAFALLAYDENGEQVSDGLIESLDFDSFLSILSRFPDSR